MVNNFTRAKTYEHLDDVNLFGYETPDLKSIKEEHEQALLLIESVTSEDGSCSTTTISETVEVLSKMIESQR